MVDMGLVTGITLSVAVITAVVFEANRTQTLSEPRAVPASSPLDEALRILSHRYARGEISYEQYDRMRSILRR